MLLVLDWKLKIVALSLVATSLLITPALAESPDDLFHRAYYLEREQNDPTAAAKLYEQALAGRGLGADLRQDAEMRLAGCREDIASRDLAKLMPPDSFAYVEIGPVGEQVKTLLDQLGILGADGRTAAPGQPLVAVSPLLVDELLGFQGAAIAINGINPADGEPAGVLETVLPAGGDPQAPIGGFATYSVEDEAIITLTHRLVVVSKSRALIEGVVRRLGQSGTPSLADQDFAARIAPQRGESLLSFFVRTEPIMPMIQGLIADAASHDPELAMVNVMVDLKSIRSLSGHVGFSDAGFSAAVQLELDKGHRSIVFNLMRTPPIDAETIEHVPAGAAAFALASFSGLSEAYHAGGAVAGDDGQVVTGMDYGREFFANIASVAVFAMPSGSDPSGPTSPVPDVAAAIVVNDPSKSEQLWSQILGLVSMASGAPTQEGQAITIQGEPVRVYPIKDKLDLHFATVGHSVLVATSRYAMARSIKTAAGGDSIRKDAAFAESLARVGPATTKALFVHPGRCLKLASKFMSDGERKEVKPFLPMLDATVASLVVNHSNERLEVALGVSNLPHIGGVLGQLIAAEKHGDVLRRATREAVARKDWAEALARVDEMLAGRPADAALMKKKFKILVLADRPDDARNHAKDMYAGVKNDAMALNNFAWSLLTDSPFEGRFNELALTFAERCNKIETDNWMYVDTLALARFVNGDVESAVELETRAVELAGKNASPQLLKTLDRFETALADKPESLSLR
ncbi:MAG: tetratricopeptide repeat protein [Phycisphaerae bacterium]